MGELLGNDALGSYTGLCASVLVLATGHAGAHLKTDMGHLPEEGDGLVMLYATISHPFPHRIDI